jgi:hypothetical protein
MGHISKTVAIYGEKVSFKEGINGPHLLKRTIREEFVDRIPIKRGELKEC